VLCFFSQWFDGIGHLIHCGKYHGDFRLENTYYHMASGFPVVKFTNFRVKGNEVKLTFLYCVLVEKAFKFLN
jgi:hypothetical protein